MWVWMYRVMRKERALVRHHGKSLVVAQRDFAVKFNYIAAEYTPDSCKRKDITESRI